MNASSSSRPPGQLRVERALRVLPHLEDLSPLLDLLVAGSWADPDRRWSASGELGAAGDRLVDAEGLASEVELLIREGTARLEARFRSASEVVRHLSAGRSEEAATASMRQGEAEEGAGRPGAAAAWFRTAHALARDSGSPLVPGALRRLARAYRSQGDLEAAAQTYEDAWREATALALEADCVVAATGRGNVAVDRGRWAEAEGWYREALALVGEKGDPRRERWQIGQNLAIVRREQGDLEEAAQWLRLAQREGEALDDADARVEVPNGWGQLRLARGDARGAELHFREAMAAARDPGARIAVGVNLGEALLAQGRDLEAGQEGREAEARAIGARVMSRLPEVYRLLAAVAQARGEADAFVLLERALEVIRERGLPPYEEALTLQAYASALEGSGERERVRELRAKAASILKALGRNEPGREDAT